MDIKQILTQLLTGKDNRTHDIIRWITLLGFIGYIALAFYNLYLTHILSLIDFATGLATIITSSGVALGLKSNSEPSIPESK